LRPGLSTGLPFLKLRLFDKPSFYWRPVICTSLNNKNPLRSPAGLPERMIEMEIKLRQPGRPMFFYIRALHSVHCERSEQKHVDPWLCVSVAKRSCDRPAFRPDCHFFVDGKVL
jgi:hypothetical protein